MSKELAHMYIYMIDTMSVRIYEKNGFIRASDLSLLG